MSPSPWDGAHAGRYEEERTHRRGGRPPDAKNYAIAFGYATLGILLFLGILKLSEDKASALDGGTGPSAPESWPSAPRQWMMCPGMGLCGQQSPQKWRRSPRKLAAEVAADLSSLPGVPSRAWDPVFAQWRDHPPVFQGRGVTLEEVAAFMKDVLSSDPFGTNDEVPYVDFRPPGEAKTVVITQRQLAFLVANVLMRNTIPSGDGLSAVLQRCSGIGSAKNSYLYSLLSLLAVLSRELGWGQQGLTLIAATPRASDDSWRNGLGSGTLKKPTLCRYQKEQGRTDCGLDDYMAGGTLSQALTNIAGGVVGGGAQLCDTADTVDESLVQFYSEVLAFSFFTSNTSAGGGMLPVPWILLGARRYLRDIHGESRPDNACGLVPDTDWLNVDISTRQTVDANIDGERLTLASSAFVAVASKCSECIAGQCTREQNLNHLCDSQRRHLDSDVALWYQAFEPTMYEAAVQDALRGVARRIGTGPWGAGEWHGDSQQYFLAVWLATSLIGGTLDYYMYDRFCENPGNQCFVLGDAGCRDCIAASGLSGIVDVSQCGRQSVYDLVQQLTGKSTQVLYDALSTVKGPPKQVFDLLGGGF